MDGAFAGEFFASIQEGEFDEEDGAEDVAAELLDEVEGGGGGAAGGEEVIGEEDGFAGADGVLVDFDGVGAVFEVVAGAEGFPGEFAFFADGDEAGVEFGGDEGAEDEATGVDADDFIDLGDAGGGDHAVDGGG